MPRKIKPLVPVDPLHEMVLATYFLLNSTNTNLTKDCLLCLDARPPFYIKFGLLVTQSSVTLGTVSLTKEQPLSPWKTFEGDATCFCSYNTP